MLTQFRLRCDREKPCQNCVSRSERANCSYKGSNSTFPTHVIRLADPVQQRIDQLEALVKRLSSQHANVDSNAAGAPPERKSTASPLESTLQDCAYPQHGAGTTVINGKYSVYQIADPWYDVLQEINDLRHAWSQSRDDALDHNVQHHTQSALADGTSLLFGHVQELGKVEIIATLPPKSAVDKLVQEFFDRETFPLSIVPILHEPAW